MEENDYNIFTSEMDILADPARSDLFSVRFYDSAGFNYRYSTEETNKFFPSKATLPKQENVLAKRWYFGTYRQDVINSDRGGETNIEFYMRCDSSYNMKMVQFLGVPIGNQFLDEEQRYKHVEFNKRFDKIEIVTRYNTLADGEVYTLYNCNVKSVQFGELDASNNELRRLTATVTYDTFDVRPVEE